MKYKALILLAEGFEEIEAISPVDILRRGEVEVHIASIESTRRVTGKTGVSVKADLLFEEIDSSAVYDLVVLPGGPGTKRLRQNEKVLDLVKAQHQAGRLLGAICAAPTVLLDAGVLKDRRYTAHFSVSDELPAIIDEPVVVDGTIITSRGAGTAVSFGLELVEALLGPETSGQIAEAICEPATV